MPKYVLTENDQINISEIAIQAGDLVYRNTEDAGLPCLASEVLLGAFAWDASPEGHDYWAGVYDKLRALAGLAPNFTIGGEPEDEEEDGEEEERSPDTDKLIRAA